MQGWNILFIEHAGATCPLLSAFVLIIGIIVMLLGWRLSRLVAVLDFSLFGVLVGVFLTIGTDLQWLGAGIGAIVLGGLALWMDRYGEAVACGLLAGMMTVAVTGLMDSPLGAVLLATAVAFGSAIALSSVAHRQASAIMTAVQGGLLAAFGLAACLTYNGQVWSGLKEVLSSSMLAQIMFMLAPIGIGITFQLASISNEEVVAH